jgi:hypothetical protein
LQKGTLFIRHYKVDLTLGDDWNQKKISLLESKETVDPEILEQVAKVLKVPAEAIKNFSEEAAINIISSTLHDTNGLINYVPTFNINPIDKWLEAMDENKKLYERLLLTEREKVEMLEKLLNEKKGNK